jgi:murein DD-endopeptidase MepM/ murein hydrolase activator NlpD
MSDSRRGTRAQLVSSSVIAMIAGAAAAACDVELESSANVTAAVAACGTARWPISNSTAPDADSLRDPYGPRLNSSVYDFHAGLDIVAAQGTAVHAVLPGTVLHAIDTWSGTGPGKNVLVQHDCDRFTAYLHLDSIAVATGQVLAAGDVIGASGTTGASSPHLHLTYMIGLTGTATDEKNSRNPLEILPHTVPANPAVSWGSLITVQLPVQRMRVRALTLADATSSRTVDYYAVVARGNPARDEQVQSGIYLEAANPSGGTFALRARVDPAGAFAPTTLTLRYIDDTTFTATAPGAAACGNSVCDAGETWYSCHADCPGACAGCLWTASYNVANPCTQWTKCQAADEDNDDGVSTRITSVASPRREGGSAGRFEVRAEDRWRGTERAEVVRSDTVEVAGTVRWYGWSTFFASGFAPPEGMWQVFTQWHHLGDTGSPPIQFAVKWPPGDPGPRMEMSTTASGGDTHTVHWTAPFTPGVWHDFLFGVRFENSATGWIELWVDGVRFVPQKPAWTMRDTGNILKQGLYRKVDISHTQVLYHDHMRVGSTRDQVD